MRMSKLFSTTRREVPADSEIASHQLLLRAGFIRQLGAGIFTSLPLARRSLDKIGQIMREEIDAIGGQEVSMPVVNPADIWQETGRWYQVGTEMGRFKDKSGHDMVLAMTHEEVVTDLVRDEIRSYRQMPALIYHIQTKWRDDPRPRAGLIRAREFSMLDSYSLDAAWDGLDLQYDAHYKAYFNIFQRCGLPVVAVEADTGMMGGKTAHEYMYLTPIGEDTLLFCDDCGYAANRQIALVRKPTSAPEEPLPLEKVATPDASTIDDLAKFLDIPASRTAKAVFMIATPSDGGRQQFIFAMVRGDMEVNETKLSNALRARELRPATESEIRASGATPGYASPVGIHDATVIVDDLIPNAPNLVAGANETGYHLRNVNFGRDFNADIVADISAASEGDRCVNCGGALRSSRGVEVANIFKLGTRYTEAMGATFLGEDGEQHPIVMGSYGIGLGRLLACIAEEHNDEHGLAWPVSVAPYPIYLVSLAGKNEQVQQAADLVAAQLDRAGLEPLYDDRSESAGVKFNDADLIGLPLRLTVSQRSLRQDSVEMKLRLGTETAIVPLDRIVDQAREFLSAA